MIPVINPQSFHDHLDKLFGFTGFERPSPTSEKTGRMRRLIGLRMSQEDHDAISQAAATAGISVSALVRVAVRSGLSSSNAS